MSLSILFDATTLGFEYALLAVGVFVTFRVLGMADMTVDGSFCLGMAVSAVFTVAGQPALGLICGALAGAAVGSITGILATKARINPLIAGIITSTGLYSINVYVLGSPNVSLLGVNKLYDIVHTNLFPGLPSSAETQLPVAAGTIAPIDISKCIFTIIIVAIVVALLIYFFKTESGLAMRAVGDNEQMSAASSINVDLYKIGGLALGNALVALTGGILAQCQGFADMTSGTGMVLVGLASVIIGEVFGGKRGVTSGIVCSVVGSVVYRIIIQVAVGVNLDANALKLISAIIVGSFMAFPAVRSFLNDHKTKKHAMAGIIAAPASAELKGGDND